MTNPLATEPTLPTLLRAAGQVTRRLTAAGLDVADWSLRVDVRPSRGSHLEFQILGLDEADRLAMVGAVARTLKARFTAEERPGFCESVPDGYVHLRGQVTRGNVVIEIVAVLFSPEACDQARAMFPAPPALAGAA